MKRDKVYRWVFLIDVQAKTKDEAILYIEDRINAFIRRGASIKEGKIEEIETGLR
jgi:hypothetical protein